MNEKLICAPGTYKKGDKIHVFLAGPIIGAPEWQFKVPDYFTDREWDDVVFLSPRRNNRPGIMFDYNEQVEWESHAMLSCDILFFWVPERDPEQSFVLRRPYAQTTRTEFGEYLARGKRMIVGCYPEFSSRRYFDSKLKEYNKGTVYTDFNDEIEALKVMIRGIREEGKNGIYFTSDTHFGSSRALELSRRPFPCIEQMDWTMIERWNNKVAPGSIVYHLGDFGETWPIDYLNGSIMFIQGNYEREGKSPYPDYPGRVTRFSEVEKVRINDLDFLLSHEPSKALSVKNNNEFILFGHIHGRQRMKEFGGLDVGVDGNNFEPYSLKDVLFYREAILKYYDNEVWL